MYNRTNELERALWSDEDVFIVAMDLNKCPLCRGIWVAGQAEGEGGLGASGNSVYLLHSFVMNLKLFYKIKSLKRKSLICPFHLASPSKKKKLLKK